MRLLGYRRVSTEEQAKQGQSLDLMTADFHRFCGQERHELLDIITDAGVSASVPLAKRKGGAELLRRLEAGEADGVLVTFADRLFRIGRDAANVGADLRESGLAILATQEHIDILDDDGWLMFWLKAGLAERDRLRIVRRAVNVSRGLKDEGKAYGPTAFGLVNLQGNLYQDPETWPVRLEIIRLHRRGFSWDAICRELESKDIPSPKGAVRWHVSTVRNIVRSHGGFERIPPLPRRDEARVSGVKA